MQQEKTGNTGFIIALIVVSVVSAAAGYWFYTLGQEKSEPPALSVSSAGSMPAVDARLIGETRPDFTLPDLGGTPRSISEWDGKIVLVNFWATWCPPCRKEMPAFVELKEQYGEQGFEIVGVAIDDPQQAQDFADTMGVNYPMLYGEIDAMEIAKAYGDRFVTLPYSVLIDRNGKIRFIKPGELHKEDLEAELKALL